MRIDWMSLFLFMSAYWIGWGVRAWLYPRGRNRPLNREPGAFRRHAAEVVYYLGECCARAGYAAAITCGILLGLGAGLPLFVAIGKVLKGGQ